MNLDFSKPITLTATRGEVALAGAVLMLFGLAAIHSQREAARQMFDAGCAVGFGAGGRYVMRHGAGATLPQSPAAVAPQLPAQPTYGSAYDYPQSFGPDFGVGC